MDSKLKIKSFTKISINIIVLLFCVGCVNEPCYRDYKFLFPSIITPAQDTFTIGDTIWYEINLSEKMVDHNTGELINLSNLDLSWFEFFIERYDTTHYVSAVPDFDYFPLIGNFQSTWWGGNAELKQPENNQFKMFLIPKKSGGYVVSGALPTYFHNEEVELGDLCKEEIYMDSRVSSNNENNNLSVLENKYVVFNNQDTTFWNDLGDWRANGLYVFYVQ